MLTVFNLFHLHKYKVVISRLYVILFLASFWGKLTQPVYVGGRQRRSKRRSCNAKAFSVFSGSIKKEVTRLKTWIQLTHLDKLIFVLGC